MIKSDIIKDYEVLKEKNFKQHTKHTLINAHRLYNFQMSDFSDNDDSDSFHHMCNL